MVTLDEMGYGLDGNVDAFIFIDLYSPLRVAYPVPDKSAELITMALRMLLATEGSTSYMLIGLVTSAKP